MDKIIPTIVGIGAKRNPKKPNDRWWRIRAHPATRLRVEKNPDLIALGQRVRALRKEAKLTQEELAERAGLSANYVGEVERGERNPSALALFAIARGMEVTVTKLVEGMPGSST